MIYPVSLMRLITHDYSRVSASLNRYGAGGLVLFGGCGATGKALNDLWVCTDSGEEFYEGRWIAREMKSPPAYVVPASIT